MSRPVRALLFDMDGLLVDTEGLHLRAFVEVARRLGVSCTVEDLTVWIGKGQPDLAAWLVEEATVPTTVEEVLADHARDLDRLLEEEPPLPMPGAFEMLAAAEERGLVRALVSSTAWPLVERIMRGFLAHLDRQGGVEAHFAAVVTGDRVRARKPDPAPYLQAAAALGLEPGDCMVFEDSPSGARAGRAAGCRVVAIPSLHLSDPGEVSAAADVSFPTLRDAHAARIWELGDGETGTARLR